MREIKFRAFNKSTKEMYPCAGFLSGQVIIIKDSQTIGCKDDDWEIQQYTGLTDKNNKEIYEGDIVESIFNDEICLVDFNDKNYASVLGWNLLSIGYFKEDKLIFCDPKVEPDGKLPATEYYYGRSPGKNWEIIGNIYENPELINETLLN
jgi:uncharacterized phage protein (TIGR01671 family)